MAAILGDTDRPIEEICAEATPRGGPRGSGELQLPGPARDQRRGGGRRARDGAVQGSRRQAGDPPQRERRVSFAAHGERGADGLAEALDDASFDDPHFPVYANVNGEAVLDAARAKELLLEQLSQPVRWTDEVLAIAARFPAALFVEMGPGTRADRVW